MNQGSGRRLLAIFVVCGALLPAQAHAFFFFVPIPNMSKPPALNALIEALEKSEETKAVAYVSEDKLFGSKMYVWGHFAGHVPQAEADRLAMARCDASLTKAKALKAGGKELYDFGNKKCELYSFMNKTVSPRANEWQPPGTPTASQPTPPAAESATTANPAESVQVDPPVAAPTAVPEVVQPVVTATPPAVTAPTPAPSSPPPVAAVKPDSPGVPTEAQPSKPPANESPTARKLRELNDLRKEGLISETEYNAKRKAILSAM
jgi:hypothetical protein